MPFTLCHAAGDMFMHSARRRSIILQASRTGDAFTLTEIPSDHAYIAALPGISSHVVGELGIGWKSARFELVDKGAKQVMQGGRRGPLTRTTGRLRRARRGPSRLVAWVVLREKATNRHVLLATHHAIAKADTAHRWRQALRHQGFAGTVAVLNAASKKHPAVPELLTGDLNTNGGILAFLRAGLHRVKAPSTYGRLAYDRIYRRGAVKVSGVRRVKTKGDHRALVAAVTLGA